MRRQVPAGDELLLAHQITASRRYVNSQAAPEAASGSDVPCQPGAQHIHTDLPSNWAWGCSICHIHCHPPTRDARFASRTLLCPTAALSLFAPALLSVVAELLLHCRCCCCIVVRSCLHSAPCLSTRPFPSYEAIAHARPAVNPPDFK